jgi:hypothetical protein
MDDTTCEIAGCPDEAVERDWCHRHYLRWYRHGDPLALMRPPETGGIYQITGPGGRPYIGSSDNVRRRWKSHKAELRRGRHHNAALQADWNEHGEAVFTFAVLEEVPDVALLIDAEQARLDKAIADGITVYNIAMDIRSPGRGRTHTQAAKLKMSAKVRAWLDRPENMERVRARFLGDRNPSSKLEAAKVMAICDRLLDGSHPAQVAADAGVTQETVYQIRSGRIWAHLVPPEMVAAMLVIRQNPNANRVIDDKRRALGAAAGRSNKGRKLGAERKARMSELSRGDSNPRAKVTSAAVGQIKGLLAAGASCKDLAAAFGIAPNSVSRIKNGETWAHVEAAPVAPELARLAIPSRREVSPEHRASISAALTGRPKSAEHRANLWRDREVTPEHREQMRHTGQAGRGKPKSADHRAKILASASAIGKSGASNSQAKLTDDQVREIKQRLSDGEKGRALAARFGVGEAVISNIKNGRTWRHIT